MAARPRLLSSRGRATEAARLRRDRDEAERRLERFRHLRGLLHDTAWSISTQGRAETQQLTELNFHGYWTRDWTAVDPALGTRDDLRALVAAAHRHGIRVIMDAVIHQRYGAGNRTGSAVAR